MEQNKRLTLWYSLWLQKCHQAFSWLFSEENQITLEVVAVLETMLICVLLLTILSTIVFSLWANHWNWNLENICKQLSWWRNVEIIYGWLNQLWILGISWHTIHLFVFLLVWPQWGTILQRLLISETPHQGSLRNPKKLYFSLFCMQIPNDYFFLRNKEIRKAIKIFREIISWNFQKRVLVVKYVTMMFDLAFTEWVEEDLRDASIRSKG